MDANTIFETLMGQLEDWYADSTRARAYDKDAGPGTHEPGHVILRVNPYPGPPWRKYWAEFRCDPVAREAIIVSLQEELYGLSHGPSQAGPASGLHRGTKEWTKAVATAEGSLRAVARRFGVSHTAVRRARLEHQVG